MNNIMYAVTVKGRKVHKQRFETYEKARQYARKIARQLLKTTYHNRWWAETPDGSQVSPNILDVRVVKI